MWLPRVALAAGAVVALAPLAHADTITGRVVEWKPAAKVLVLSDRSRITVDPKLVTADPTGKRVVITYRGAEGIDAVTAVKVID